jgi:hypothetical protein
MRLRLGLKNESFKNTVSVITPGYTLSMPTSRMSLSIFGFITGESTALVPVVIKESFPLLQN